VQQAVYLVEVGSRVEKGQPIAELRGPEMHHFLTEMDVARELLETAEKRFSSNKRLYESKAIKESQWLEVSEKYYAAMLEYEHMRHFNDLVISVDELNDMIVIAAPISGVIDYSPEHSDIKSGDDIAIIVPISAIRMKAFVPIEFRNELVSLTGGNCTASVDSVGSVANGFLVPAWSAPLPPQCELILGQTLLVTPQYRSQAYSIPLDAVFQWDKSSSILVQHEGSLKLLVVTLLGSSDGAYTVSSTEPLDGLEVLVTSVSAVQGVLLGLGGE
jgi:hypothetical protein